MWIVEGCWKGVEGVGAWSVRCCLGKISLFLFYFGEDNAKDVSSSSTTKKSGA